MGRRSRLGDGVSDLDRFVGILRDGFAMLKHSAKTTDHPIAGFTVKDLGGNQIAVTDDKGHQWLLVIEE